MEPSPEILPPAQPPVPIGLIRSALFRIAPPIKKADENGELRAPYLVDVSIPAAKAFGIELKYTGPYLTQHHALLWQAVLQAAHEKGARDGRVFIVPAGVIERALGLKDETHTRRRILQDLIDLSKAHIDLKTTRIQYAGSLIFSVAQAPKSRKLSIRLNDDIAGLLTDEVLFNNFQRKAALGRDGLTLWLHDYIGSQLRMPPTPLSDLRELCGAKRTLRLFRQQLREAMDRLSTGEGRLVTAWNIDASDRLIVRKAKTPVNVGKAAVAEKKDAGKRYESDLERKARAATKRRTEVAL